MASKSLTFDIYGRDKTASKTIKGIGDDVDRTAERFKTFGKIAAAGLAVVAAAAIKFGADAVQAAAQAAQVGIKTDKIFEGNADEIKKWASTAAKNLGMSGAAAMGAAADFGNMFLQLGIGARQATDMSKSTVKLAADLAAFNGLDTATTLEMISAAFRGEYDSLQRLIPNINAARVETEALAMTGKTNADQLTAQEKAMATLAIITNDGAMANGALADSADTLIGRQRAVEAAFEDTKVKIGEALIPAAEALMTMFQEDLMPVLEDFADWFVSDGLPALEGFFAFLSENKDTLLPVAIGIGGVTAALWALNVALYANPIVLAIAGIVAGLAWLGATVVWVANDFEGASGTVVDAAQGMVVGVSSAFGALITWVSQLIVAFANGWNQIVGAFQWAGEQIHSFSTTINSSLAGFVSSAITTLAQLPGQIMGIFAGAGSWLLTAGANIVNGLINGIRGAISGAAKAAADMANAALTAAKSALGIHSPSRKFEAEVGAMIPAGAERGIAKGMPDLGRRVDSMFDSLGSNARSTPAAVVAPASSDRPIYADGMGLIGFIRELANGEARLVFEMGGRTDVMTSKMGWQR